jgi:hypothetical protein
MKTIWYLCWAGLLAACAAPHAARVSCDSKLRPINAPAASASAPLADAVVTKALDGAP